MLQNIWRNNVQNFSKLDENYKLTNPRSSMDPKYEKHEENYMKSHQNQIAQYHWKRENHKITRDKRHLTYKGTR